MAYVRGPAGTRFRDLRAYPKGSRRGARRGEGARKMECPAPRASPIHWSMHLRILGAAVVSALALAGGAHAAGGNYVFAGGSATERAQVVQALDASAFPWGLVPQTITIHIEHGLDSDAIPGHVFVDADLLDSGRFA